MHFYYTYIVHVYYFLEYCYLQKNFPLYNIQETTKNEKKVRDAYPRDFYRLFLREWTTKQFGKYQGKGVG